MKRAATRPATVPIWMGHASEPVFTTSLPEARVLEARVRWFAGFLDHALRVSSSRPYTEVRLWGGTLHRLAVMVRVEGALLTEMKRLDKLAEKKDTEKALYAATRKLRDTPKKKVAASLVSGALASRLPPLTTGDIQIDNFTYTHRLLLDLVESPLGPVLDLLGQFTMSAALTRLLLVPVRVAFPGFFDDLGFPRLTSAAHRPDKKALRKELDEALAGVHAAGHRGVKIVVASLDMSSVLAFATSFVKCLPRWKVEVKSPAKAPEPPPAKEPSWSRVERELVRASRGVVRTFLRKYRGESVCAFALDIDVDGQNVVIGFDTLQNPSKKTARKRLESPGWFHHQELGVAQFEGWEVMPSALLEDRVRGVAERVLAELVKEGAFDALREATTPVSVGYAFHDKKTVVTKVLPARRGAKH